MANLFNEEQQKAVDEIIKDKQDQWKRKYENYLSPDDVKTKTEGLEKKISDLTTALEESNKKSEGLTKDIADRDSRIKAYELHSVKTRIAHEAGLGYDAIEFLKGDDEDSIKASAEALKTLVGTGKPVPPVLNEPSIGGDASTQSIRQLAKQLTTN